MSFRSGIETLANPTQISPGSSLEIAPRHFSKVIEKSLIASREVSKSSRS
jgi:hypothetical protein